MRTPGFRGLSVLLGVAGTAHFLTPRPFERIVPPALGDPRPWVVGSGAAELACAAGLLPRRTRRAAALTAAGLFLVVYPGNVQQALDARGAPSWYRIATLVRLPMQVPLVVWALRVARDAGVGRGG